MSQQENSYNKEINNLIDFALNQSNLFDNNFRESALFNNINLELDEISEFKHNVNLDIFDSEPIEPIGIENLITLDQPSTTTTKTIEKSTKPIINNIQPQINTPKIQDKKNAFVDFFKQPQNLLQHKRKYEDNFLKDSPTNKHLTIFLVIYTTTKCDDHCDFLLTKIGEKIEKKEGSKINNLFCCHMKHFGSNLCHHLIAANFGRQISTTINFWELPNFNCYFTNAELLWDKKIKPSKATFEAYYKEANNPDFCFKILTYKSKFNIEERNLETLWNEIKTKKIKTKYEAAEYCINPLFDQKSKLHVLTKLDSIMNTIPSEENFPITLEPIDYENNKKLPDSIKHWIRNDLFGFINNKSNNINFIKRVRWLVIRGARGTGKTSFFTQLLMKNPKGEPAANPTIVYSSGNIACEDFEKKPNAAYIVMDDVNLHYKDNLQYLKKICTGQTSRFKSLYKNTLIDIGRPCILLVNELSEFNELRLDDENWNEQNALFVDLGSSKLYEPVVEEDKVDFIKVHNNYYVNAVLLGDSTVKAVLKTIKDICFDLITSKRKIKSSKKLIAEIVEAMAFFEDNYKEDLDFIFSENDMIDFKKNFK